MSDNEEITWFLIPGSPFEWADPHMGRSSARSAPCPRKIRELLTVEDRLKLDQVCKGELDSLEVETTEGRIKFVHYPGDEDSGYEIYSEKLPDIFEKEKPSNRALEQLKMQIAENEELDTSADAAPLKDPDATLDAVRDRLQWSNALRHSSKESLDGPELSHDDEQSQWPKSADVLNWKVKALEKRIRELETLLEESDSAHHYRGGAQVVTIPKAFFFGGIAAASLLLILSFALSMGRSGSSDFSEFKDSTISKLEEHENRFDELSAPATPTQSTIDNDVQSAVSKLNEHDNRIQSLREELTEVQRRLSE